MTRRAALALPLLAAGCGRRRGSGFPGYALVANEGARAVAAIDLTAFSVARTIPLEGAPGPVVSAAGAAWVLEPATGTLTRIADLKPGVRARVQPPAPALRVSPGGKTIWALDAQSLAGFDAVTGAPETRVKLPGPALDFDLNERAPEAVISLAGGRAVLALLDSGRIEEIPAPAACGAVRFRSDGRYLILAHPAERSITLLDRASKRVVVRLPLPIAPESLCFTSDRGQLFVAGPGMDAVAIVYPYSTEVAETLLAGRAPGAMAVARSPEGGEYLFAANPQSGDVTVLDVATRKMVAALAVGRDPGHIAITPDQQYALVLNRQSGDVAVIRIPWLSAAGNPERSGLGKRYPAPLFTMIPVGSKPVAAAVVTA